MIFEPVTKVENEVLKCFIPIRKNFVYSSKSAVKQLGIIIKNSIGFYKVFDDKKFIGCLFVDDIDDSEKIITFGGFAFRHVNTRQAIKEFIAFFKYHFPNYTIKATTRHKTAKTCLIGAGFKNVKGDYIYG